MCSAWTDVQSWELLFSLVASRSQIYGQLQRCFSRQQRHKPAVIKENTTKDCTAEGRGKKQILQLCKRFILFSSNSFPLLLKAASHATRSVLLPLQ